MQRNAVSTASLDLEARGLGLVANTVCCSTGHLVPLLMEHLAQRSGPAKLSSKTFPVSVALATALGNGGENL